MLLIAVATSVVASSTVQTGCFWATTKHEGKVLRKDVEKLDSRLANQEASLGTKVAELETVLAKATKLLGRNSADLGAEVDGLEQENTRLSGLIARASELTTELKAADTLQRKLNGDRFDALEKRLALLEEKVNRVPAKSANDLFQEGKAAFDSGNYTEAREAFKTLVVKYSTHALADDAQYYRGEALYRGKSYQLSLGELQKVFEKYPKSSWAPKALYRAGEGAMALKWCTDARAYFGLLRQKYPRSDLASKAKRKDTELRKNASNKRKCQQN